MTTLRALIWDVDGTLAETEDLGHRPAFNAAFADAGLPWRWDSATYARLLETTGGKERILRWWREVDPAGADAPGTAERIRALHEAKTRHYVRAVAEGRVHLRPGVRRLLHEARALGLRQAIATTTTLANVQALLQATLGDDEAALTFEVIGAGDVVPRKKPAPDIYLWVLERMGLAAAECLAIEDSAAGVAAAQGAGLACVATRSLYTRDQILGSGPLADLSDLGDPPPAGVPAVGSVLQGPWQGVVWPADLARWTRARALPPACRGARPLFQRTV
jgi:beta-phosphoglucomutase-like phosphatase (HAD superfamily)